MEVTKLLGETTNNKCVTVSDLFLREIHFEVC